MYGSKYGLYIYVCCIGVKSYIQTKEKRYSYYIQTCFQVFWWNQGEENKDPSNFTNSQLEISDSKSGPQDKGNIY